MPLPHTCTHRPSSIACMYLSEEKPLYVASKNPRPDTKPIKYETTRIIPRHQTSGIFSLLSVGYYSTFNDKVAAILV